MRIKNWQYLCIFGRLAAPYIDINGKMIYHDNRDIVITADNTSDEPRLIYTDYNSGEVLLIQDEEGFPAYESEWAKQIPNDPYPIA